MVNEKTQDMREFVLEFFKFLKCKVIEKENYLKINNAPKDFEDFLGKEAPYILVFNQEQLKELGDAELITKGSYFLASIRDYLDDKGQTTVLSLMIPIVNPNKEIKKEINFNNCKLIDVGKKEGKKYLTKFTFFSSCQYLNEKKQFVSPFYISNNKVLDLDLEKYNFQEGDKNDLEVKNLHDSYNVAKEELNNVIKKEIKDTKLLLKEKLDNELNRLNKHFNQQINEKDEELDKYQEKVTIFKGQLENAYYDKDIKALKNKIKKYEDYVERLKKEGYKERLKVEKSFHIQDEIDKYSLKIDNNLINLSIVHYPAFIFTISLKKGDLKKEIKISYDSLLKKLDLPICDSCKNPTKDINLCTNGHIVCNNCIKKCPDCKNELCGVCLNSECDDCHKKICKDCVTNCKSCKGKFCKDHIKKCPICKEDLCMDCLKECEFCKEMVCKDHFKKCTSCDREICEKCFKKEVDKCDVCSDNICSKCGLSCKTCKKTLCKKHAKKCKDCDSIFCLEHLKKCSVCNNSFCKSCLRKCEGCGKLVCQGDLLNCKKCGSKICKKCVVYKKAFLGLLAKKRCVKCVEVNK